MNKVGYDGPCDNQTTTDNYRALMTNISSRILNLLSNKCDDTLVKVNQNYIYIKPKSQEEPEYCIQKIIINVYEFDIEDSENYENLLDINFVMANHEALLKYLSELKFIVLNNIGVFVNYQHSVEAKIYPHISGGCMTMNYDIHVEIKGVLIGKDSI